MAEACWLLVDISWIYQSFGSESTFMKFFRTVGPPKIWGFPGSFPGFQGTCMTRGRLHHHLRTAHQYPGQHCGPQQAPRGNRGKNLEACWNCICWPWNNDGYGGQESVLAWLYSIHCQRDKWQMHTGLKYVLRTVSRVTMAFNWSTNKVSLLSACFVCPFKGPSKTPNICMILDDFGIWTQNLTSPTKMMDFLRSVTFSQAFL